jgi:DNA-binding transcriptional MerR regulator
MARAAQAAGLTLRDIKHLFGLQRGQSRVACQRMRRLLAARLVDVDERATDIQVFRTMLEGYLAGAARRARGRAAPRCPSSYSR